MGNLLAVTMGVARAIQAEPIRVHVTIELKLVTRTANSGLSKAQSLSATFNPNITRPVTNSCLDHKQKFQMQY